MDLLPASTSVNLLPWRDLRYQKKRQVFLIMLAFCINCALCGWSLTQWQQQRWIRIEDQRIHTLQQQTQDLSQTLQKARQQQTQQGFLNSAIESHKVLLAMLALLAEKMPDSVYLSQIESKDDHMTLWGNAPNHADIALFLQQMELVIHKEHAQLAETHSTHAQQSERTFQIVFNLKALTFLTLSSPPT